ncbi:hypothetical protein [Nostoc sp.]|uniref:hypothetical protein n=1 Tax=Nostoc sp. TaxID=1180 RepID=UPI002FF478FA
MIVGLGFSFGKLALEFSGENTCSELRSDWSKASFLSVYSSLLAIWVCCWDRGQKILIASWECDRMSLYAGSESTTFTTLENTLHF